MIVRQNTIDYLVLMFVSKLSERVGGSARKILEAAKDKRSKVIFFLVGSNWPLLVGKTDQLINCVSPKRGFIFGRLVTTDLLLPLC